MYLTVSACLSVCACMCPSAYLCLLVCLCAFIGRSQTRKHKPSACADIPSGFRLLFFLPLSYTLLPLPLPSPESKGKGWRHGATSPAQAACDGALITLHPGPEPVRASCAPGSMVWGHRPPSHFSQQAPPSTCFQKEKSRLEADIQCLGDFPPFSGVPPPSLLPCWETIPETPPQSSLHSELPGPRKPDLEPFVNESPSNKARNSHLADQILHHTRGEHPSSTSPSRDSRPLCQQRGTLHLAPLNFPSLILQDSVYHSLLIMLNPV